MNLASAIDSRHGEGIAERHVDSAQLDMLTLRQQEFSKRVSPADRWSEQTACRLQQTLTNGNGCDDRRFFQATYKIEVLVCSGICYRYGRAALRDAWLQFSDDVIRRKNLGTDGQSRFLSKLFWRATLHRPAECFLNLLSDDLAKTRLLLYD